MSNSHYTERAPTRLGKFTSEDGTECDKIESQRLDGSWYGWFVGDVASVADVLHRYAIYAEKSASASLENAANYSDVLGELMAREGMVADEVTAGRFYTRAAADSAVDKWLRWDGKHNGKSLRVVQRGDWFDVLVMTLRPMEPDGGA